MFSIGPKRWTGIKTDIRTIYTRGNEANDTGRYVTTDSQIDPLLWIKENAFGSDAVVITMSFISEGLFVGQDQKVFSLVKEGDKTVGVMEDASIEFPEIFQDHVVRIIKSDMDLIKMHSYYSKDALMLLIDAALCSGDKELFMSLTKDLKERN